MLTNEDETEQSALTDKRIREFCEEVLRLREENDRLRNALSPFAKVGNPEKGFKWIGVRFEWCEAAFRALDGKEVVDGK